MRSESSRLVLEGLFERAYGRLMEWLSFRILAAVEYAISLCRAKGEQSMFTVRREHFTRFGKDFGVHQDYCNFVCDQFVERLQPQYSFIVSQDPVWIIASRKSNYEPLNQSYLSEAGKFRRKYWGETVEAQVGVEAVLLLKD